MARQSDDELRPEYDLSQLKCLVRGKYHKRAMSGTDLVLIEPDLANLVTDIGGGNGLRRQPARPAR